MPATYEPIASTTVGTATGTVSFTSIASTFTDLVLVAHVVPLASGSGNVYLNVRFNNDSGSNYSLTQLYGTGSTAASLRASSQTLIEVEGSSFRSAAVFSLVGHIQSYANSNVFKTSLWTTSRSDAIIRKNVALWRDTTAIDRVDVLVTGTNTDVLDVGTTVSLYGIKAA